MDLENCRGIFLLHAQGLRNARIAERVGRSHEWVRQTLLKLAYLPRRSVGHPYSGNTYNKLPLDERAPNPGERPDVESVILERNEWRSAELLACLEERRILVPALRLSPMLRGLGYVYDRRTWKWTKR